MHIFVSEIHEKALRLASEYKRVEAELLSVIQEVDRLRIFKEYGYTSTFDYVIKALGLSEATAFNLISVARKARQIPEIKGALERGAVTLSKVRKVLSVITPENQSEWLKKAQSLPCRKLEEEVAKLSPLALREERVTVINEEIRELRIPVSREVLEKLERVKDLEKTSSMQAVLETIISFYLDKRDPLRKSPTQSLKPVTGTVHIPRRSRREALKRDQARCAHIEANGERCKNSRYVELHHIIPRAEGGTHAPENLRVLCSAHHQMLHELL